jgi:rod shape-determining protein MreC
MNRADHFSLDDKQNQARDAIAPALETLSYPVRAAGNTREAIQRYFFAVEENLELKKSNRQLAQQISILLEQAAENQRLKRLIHVVEQGYQPIVTARVLTDVSGPFARSILISAGLQNGVEKGMAVVNDEGLVGRVTDVGLISARVLLITDINGRVPVVASVSRERAILAGNNGDAPTLEYLPLDSNIQSGEMVVTSGEGLLFPPGILVGKIQIGEDKTYHVTPAVTWHRLDLVSVLAPDQEETSPSMLGSANKKKE